MTDSALQTLLDDLRQQVFVTEYEVGGNRADRSKVYGVPAPLYDRALAALSEQHPMAGDTERLLGASAKARAEAEAALSVERIEAALLSITVGRGGMDNPTIRELAHRQAALLLAALKGDSE